MIRQIVFGHGTGRPDTALRVWGTGPGEGPGVARMVTRPRSTAALATKHGKETVFAPILASVDIDVVVCAIDTDRFGTFAGEIERIGTPGEVVVAKARAAVTTSGERFGLASEGSFGPHHALPYVMVDRELVAWIDTEHDHVVLEQVTELSSVPGSTTLEQPDDVDGLRIVTLFPEQAAIVVHVGTRRTVLAKGITDVASLRDAVIEAFRLGDGTVVVEPDLRAHLCPARRDVIAMAVRRLAERLATECPECGASGFGALDTIPGLACGLCGLPTRLPAADLLGCTRCHARRQVDRTGTADPTHCDRCNP